MRCKHCGSDCWIPVPDSEVRRCDNCGDMDRSKMDETYKLYRFTGQLEAFENDERNIAGWYNDRDRALKDMYRCSNMFGGQFLVVCDKKIIGITYSGTPC